MNKKIKKTAIIIITLQLLICLYEIVHTYLNSIPKYALTIDTSNMIFKHYKHIYQNITKIVIFYGIIILMDYKVQNEFEDDMTPRFSFLSKYNTLIIIYLYFLQ